VWFIVIYLKFIISCSCGFFFLYSSDFCATCSTCIVFWPLRYCPLSNFPLSDAFTSLRTFQTAYKLMVLIVTCFRGSPSVEMRETTNQNLIWLTSRFLLKIMFIGLETVYKTWLKFLIFMEFYLGPPPPHPAPIHSAALHHYTMSGESDLALLLAKLCLSVRNSVSSKNCACTGVLINP
jgi:hypothetical protein